ncbi:MAG TPA: hypothetical protein PLV70_06060 [Flavobacteriales bacterium]|nr:hypothetical protein [Flavobacteriales bacterium]HRN36125.1 hypothetical protein [Flavobacteriales bacterium]HRO40066.1 hypothetical protein [Flavobacteriales bacterium]HRP82676.1 hypothetical protein [Flavobacteriales bacterium]HRQ84661.1 hypothetical protein [Flavobacteriales bacterium]
MTTKAKKSIEWALSPAPESKDHFTIKPQYELFIGGKWQKPKSGIRSTFRQAQDSGSRNSTSSTPPTIKHLAITGACGRSIGQNHHPCSLEPLHL